MTDLPRELSKLKANMLNDRATTFLTPEIFKTEVLFDETIPSAATDGKVILFNPKFFEEMTFKNKVFVLSHEVLHMLFEHLDTAKLTSKDPEIFNYATDSVVNATLKMANIGEIKPGGIDCDWNGNVELKVNGATIIIKECHKKSALEVYDELIKHIRNHPPKQGQGRPVMDGSGKRFDDHKYNKSTPEQKKEAKKRLQDIFAEGKMKGNVPGFLMDKIEKMLESKVDWRAELKERLLPRMKTRPTYSKPKRNNPYRDFILPGMKKEGLNIIVAIDTSGSIGMKERKYFLGEIDAIFNCFPPNSVKMTVMFHDTVVYHQFDAADATDVMREKQRSGGTSHIDVFEKADAERPDTLVLLTDGESDFPQDTCIPNVIWICTDKSGAKRIPDNLGKVIQVDLRDLREGENGE